MESFSLPLAGGVLFELILTLSGMSDPSKVLGFLDAIGDWVPDLIFVMRSAVIVTALFTPVVLSRARPLFADGFSMPTDQALDARLFVGAVLFGTGWGLSG